jgi:hypothetical protein
MNSVSKNIGKQFYLQDPRIYKDLKKLNSSKNHNPIKKMVTELKRTFSKEEVQDPR